MTTSYAHGVAYVTGSPVTLRFIISIKGIKADPEKTTVIN